MDDRETARRAVEDARERLTSIAVELKRRATGEYVRGRAREVAVKKSVEMKNRVLESPLMIGVIGGVVSAGIAKAIQGRRGRADEYETERYAAGYGGGMGTDLGETAGFDTSSYDAGSYTAGTEGTLGEAMSDAAEDTGGPAGDVRSRAADLKNRASARVGDVKNRAASKVGHMKERASERLGGLRERMPSAGALRSRASGYYHRTVDNEPVLTGLAALAIGAAVGLLIPVSSRERQVLSPLVDRVGDKLDAAGRGLEERLSGGEMPQGSEGTENPPAGTDVTPRPGEPPPVGA